MNSHTFVCAEKFDILQAAIDLSSITDEQPIDMQSFDLVGDSQVSLHDFSVDSSPLEFDDDSITDDQLMDACEQYDRSGK
jgi:hypothetical protein